MHPLDAQMADLDRRRVAVRKVAVRVIEGRLTLFEAAAQLRDLETQMADAAAYRRRVREGYSGKSYEECLCLRVIGDVLLLAETRPKLKDVADHLQDQLTEHLSRYGRVRLPEQVRLERPPAKVPTPEVKAFEPPPGPPAGPE
jgi:hypothetical protein